MLQPLVLGSTLKSTLEYGDPDLRDNQEWDEVIGTQRSDCHGCVNYSY